MHRDLIVNAARDAAAAGGYPVPSWAAPEEPPDADNDDAAGTAEQDADVTDATRAIAAPGKSGCAFATRSRDRSVDWGFVALAGSLFLRRKKAMARSTRPRAKG